MLKKLDIRDRTQAAIMAWKIGFAQLSPDTLGQVIGAPRNEENEV
jgi:hypothetical protein